MATIAVFDSGIGGLTVLQRLRNALPSAEYIYYADLEHVPYGKKSPTEIKIYMDRIIEDLVAAGSDAVVLACNTATSAAAASLRQKWDLPIIGMEPAVKPAATVLPQKDGGRIIVAATDLTLQLEKLQKLIQSLNVEDKIDRLSLQDLVNFAEEGIFDGPEIDSYLKNTFAKIDLNKVQTVVLGCTHFLYFYESLRRFLPSHIDLIDGHDGTVRRVLSFFSCDIMERNNELNPIRYIVSGKPANSSELTFFDECMKRSEKIHTIIRKEREDRRHETDDVCR